MEEAKKYKVKLINPRDEPFRHPDFAIRNADGVWETDENGSLKHSKEFMKGDVMEVGKETAQHLIVSKQGELVDPADAVEVMNYE